MQEKFSWTHIGQLTSNAMTKSIIFTKNKFMQESIINLINESVRTFTNISKTNIKLF